MPSNASSLENGPAASDAPRHRFRRVALAPLWVASVLVLALGIAALAAYLMVRQPEVVERVLPPPPPPEGMAEATRRAEALRALNAGLRAQIEALHRELQDPPQCPPGTVLDSANDQTNSMLPGAGPFFERGAA